MLLESGLPLEFDGHVWGKILVDEKKYLIVILLVASEYIVHILFQGKIG